MSIKYYFTFFKVKCSDILLLNFFLGYYSKFRHYIIYYVFVNILRVYDPKKNDNLL